MKQQLQHIAFGLKKLEEKKGEVFGLMSSNAKERERKIGNKFSLKGQL